MESADWFTVRLSNTGGKSSCRHRKINSIRLRCNITVSDTGFSCSMSGRYWCVKRKWCGRKSSWHGLRYYTNICLEGPTKNMKHLTKSGQSLPQHGFEALHTEPSCYVASCDLTLCLFFLSCSSVPRVYRNGSEAKFSRDNEKRKKNPVSTWFKTYKSPNARQIM
jgi:hypothetical protein